MSFVVYFTNIIRTRLFRTKVLHTAFLYLHLNKFVLCWQDENGVKDAFEMLVKFTIELFDVLKEQTELSILSTLLGGSADPVTIIHQ